MGTAAEIQVPTEPQRTRLELHACTTSGMSHKVGCLCVKATGTVQQQNAARTSLGTERVGAQRGNKQNPRKGTNPQHLLG